MAEERRATSDERFEGLSTRVRELLLAQAPGTSADELAERLLASVAEDFHVPERYRDDFVDFMFPMAIATIASVRSGMRREILREASAAYEARPVRGRVRSSTGNGGRSIREHHKSTAAEGESQSISERQETYASPSPVELRMMPEVLRGYRALRNEPLPVPGVPDATYGSATVQQWRRRLVFLEDKANGIMQTFKDESLIVRIIEETPGASCLNDVLDGASRQLKA